MVEGEACWNILCARCSLDDRRDLIVRPPYCKMWMLNIDANGYEQIDGMRVMAKKRDDEDEERGRSSETQI